MSSRVPIKKVTWTQSFEHIKEVFGLWRIVHQSTTHPKSIVAQCFWLGLNGRTF
jgi:hypothetical protein